MLTSSVLTVSLLMSAQAAPTAGPAVEPAAEAQAPTEEVTQTALADPQAEAVREQATIDDDDKIICRRTAIVGSRFKKRICGTQKEWESMRRRSRDATEGMQRSGRGAAVPNSGG